MAIRIKQTTLLLLFILISAASFRFYGLERRLPTPDESNHYRTDMSLIHSMVDNLQFREHSVKHTKGNAPHGMFPLMISYGAGKIIFELFDDFLPKQPMKKENFLSRFAPASMSLLTVLIVYALALALYRREDLALTAAGLAAISPNLINWGRSEYLDSAMTFFAILSLFTSWLALESKTKFKHYLLIGLSGGLAGLAISSKWSFLILLPFQILALLVYQRLNRKLQSYKDFSFLLVFGISFLFTSALFLSLQSWLWVLFPNHFDPGNLYGDMKEDLLTTIKIASIHAFTDLNNIKALFVYWGGPVIPFVLSVGGFLFWKSYAAHDRSKAYFVAITTLGAVAFNVFQQGFWYGNRGYYLITFMYLVGAGAFSLVEQPRRRAILVAVILFTVLPFSFYEGLRLGKTAIPYYGSERILSGDLPDQADTKLFNPETRRWKRLFYGASGRD